MRGVVPSTDEPSLVVWLQSRRPAELVSTGIPVWWFETGFRDGLFVARLVETVDAADRVLREGWFPAEVGRSPPGATAERWPARLIAALLDGIALPSETAPRVPLRGDSKRQQLRRRLARMRRWTQLPGWTVGIADVPIQAFLTTPTPPIRWLKPPSGRFLADPFAYESEHGLTLLVEDYEFGAERGRISMLTDRDGFLSPRPVVATDSHLSYPYVFEHGGHRYGVPESSARREVALYRIERRPGGDRWARIATLLDGVAAVDSTLFEHHGRWWLLCTCADDLDTTNLHAFHADDLFGPYRPHPLNPVKSDVRGSRPGGTPFVHANGLYRPAQDCSRAYGGAVVIHEIIELTPTSFREVPRARVEPDRSGPYPDGLHTLSAVGSRTVVDGNRRVRLRDDPRLLVRSRLAALASGLGRVLRRSDRFDDEEGP